MPSKGQELVDNLTTKNTNIMSKKELYAAPETEVLELILENAVAVASKPEGLYEWEEDV